MFEHLGYRNNPGETDMTLLNDKIAIITGASTGIGRSAAKHFAREGAKLVVSGRRLDSLDAGIT
jgi:NADP-dependent 3-hydroxy acid dehydrogenase YdfG